MVKRALIAVVLTTSVFVVTVWQAPAPAETEKKLASHSPTMPILSVPQHPTPTTINIAKVNDFYQDLKRYLDSVKESSKPIKPRSVNQKKKVQAEPPAPLATKPGCQYEALIRSIWLRDADWAIWVVTDHGWGTGESNCQADAKNPRSSAAGLFQLTKVHSQRMMRVCGYVNFFDAKCNVATAWDLYLEQGRRPWNV